LPERWFLVTGVDLEWADSFLLEVQDGPTTEGSPEQNVIRPAGKHYDYTVTSTVGAAYGQLEFALTEDLYLGAGLRLEHVGYDYDNRMLAGNTDENGVPCTPTGCLYSRPADREDTFFNAAPKLSVRWQVREHLALYANVSRGFRPPEMTEMYRLQRTQSAADLDSEQIDAIELGLKAAPGAWYVELAAFDMRKDEVILRDSNGFYVSDGRTSHQGLEYQVSWQPRDWVTAAVSGTFARHRYEFSKVIEGGETISRGNDVDTAPRELLRAALEFRPREAWSAEAEWLAVGDYFIDASNQHRYSGVRGAQPARGVGLLAALDRDPAREQRTRPRLCRSRRLRVRRLPVFPGATALGVRRSHLALGMSAAGPPAPIQRRRSFAGRRDEA
ncbi:MAG: hypothetical protein K0R70_2398, partial [Steroidobacteraceae bacterium]|nr:hypothetical protein [Steroidobacteraceae bacterium]